jgi:molybdopterin molybdotransferase
MLTPAEALARITEAVPVLPAVELDFREAAGLVLAEAIVADADLPAWPNSGMDGWAVRAADIAEASADTPARLRIAGDLPAGRAADMPVGPGEAIRIMTGAPIPPGADAVAIVETSRTEGNTVLLSEAVRPGANVRRAGENVRAGETVLEPGHPLRPADIGLLASLGQTRVRVHPRPRVGVLSSGDELVPPESQPGPGQIRDSNRFTLLAHLAALGFPAVDLGNSPDREEELADLFRRGAASCDVLVSSGGVSVGDYDLTKTVLSRLGTMHFWRVAIRPGKPLAFGFVDGTPVFGLPGNPVSSLVVLDQFVRPALRRMAGHARLARPIWRATLEESIRRAPGRTEFLRAVIRWDGRRFVARSTGPQGSGILKSLSRANGFLVVPPEVSELPAGIEVDCQLFVEDI